MTKQDDISPILPGFFIIGAPKCGTTTLYDWLGQHPEVWAPHKEPCFFSQDIFPTDKLSTHIPDLDTYCRIFRSPEEQTTISGESTPKYLYSGMAISKIHELAPDAKIIVCLRDPVDLMVSLHSQKIREAEEYETDFQTAWLRSIRPDGSVNVDDPLINGKINYAFWGNFAENVEHVQKQFPEKNIRIYIQRELSSASQDVFSDLCTLLGVGPCDTIQFTRSNTGRSLRNVRLHLAVLTVRRILQPVLRPLQRLTGGKGFGILRVMNRLNTGKGTYSDGVPDEFKTGIRQHFTRETDLLAKLEEQSVFLDQAK